MMVRRKNDEKSMKKETKKKKQREKTPFKASEIDSVIEEEEFSFRMNTKDKEEEKEKDKENNKALNKTNTVKKKKNEFHKKFDYERDLKDAKLVSNEKIEKVKNFG